MSDDKQDDYANVIKELKELGACTNSESRSALLNFLNEHPIGLDKPGWDMESGSKLGSGLGVVCQDGRYYDALNLPKGFVVKGDLDLSGMDLTELPDLSTVTVKGNFYCGCNKLTDLKGAPKKVSGNVYCDDNQLVSLLDMPKNFALMIKFELFTALRDIRTALTSIIMIC